MKVRSAVCAVFVFLSAAVFAGAGDVASFVNLGFSDDSAYFMFGFHGAEADTGKPFAEIFTVDVKANSFVSGGAKKAVYPDILKPGQGSEGAFFTLLEENGPLTRKSSINHLKQGRLLYIMVNGDESKESLEFRDFNTGSRYKVRLIQNARGVGADAKAAFHIEFETTLKDGRPRTYSVGLPGHYRENVLAYRIKQVILSPDERHLVFIVEKDHFARGGKSVRYMAETVKLF